MRADLRDAVACRAEAIFREHGDAIHRRTDRLFAALMPLQWAAAVLAARWLSPLTWTGRVSETHLHVWAALLLGGALTLFPVALVLLRPGKTFTRHVTAVGQMSMSALLIHLCGGRIETHFHIFGSLAFLAFYRDWKVFGPATVVVAADHFLRGLYWPESVYGVASVSPWRWLEHSAWVVFEDAFLVIAIRQSLREMRAIAHQRAEIEAANERTERAVAARTSELAASEERFRSLSAASPVGIFENDAVGRATYLNARWGEITGVPDTGAMGDGWRETVHPDDRARVLREWEAAVRAGRELATEYRVLTPGGGIRWIACRSNPMLGDDGRLRGHVGTIMDITERKEAELQLAEVRDRALEATRIKSQFLANMSHEIRTPMNAIIGMTDVVLDSDLTDEQRESLEVVKQASRALLTLIDDILDLSKIEAGRIVFETLPFGLRDTLEEVVSTLAIRAHQKGVELACDVAADVPDALLGDPGRLRQMLINLVGNAVKFTDRGEVVVAVGTAGIGKDDVTLHVAVTDQGIGIALDKQEAVFAPFVQADGSMTRRYGGTGLGLSIASQLVERMGGRIWLESEAGRGTTFHFTARLLLCPAPSATPPAAGGLHGLRVLVADASATGRSIVIGMLEGWGAVGLAVEDAGAAMAALAGARRDGTPIAIAILDARLSGPGGGGLAVRIASDPALADTKILLLAPAGVPADERFVAARVAKPVRRSHLLEAIQATRRGEVVHRSEALPGIIPAAVSLRILVAEDNAINRRVMLLLLEKRGHSVVLVEGGAQVLEALERERFDVILMDVEMPGMNGIETTAAVRAREADAERSTPIVAVTAHAMAGDRQRCLDAGMNAYVAKPVDPPELYATVERLARAPGPRPAPPAPAPPALPDGVFDRRAFLAHTGGDAELALQLARMLHGESARLLADIRAGLGGRDAGRVTRAAHTLLGILKTVAAPAASAVALQIEDLGRSGRLDDADHACGALEREIERLERTLAAFEAP